MTEPTDAEIRGLAATGNGVYQDDETAIWEITDPSLLKFARAVLAKWGTPPAVAGEPVAYLHDDGYWTAAKTDAGRSLNDRLLFAGSPKVAVYPTPQPTQAQAGAVPLTDGQAKEVLWAEHLRWMRAAGLDTEGMRPTGEWLDHWLTYVRAIERAHGIGIKGGQHG